MSGLGPGLPSPSRWGFPDMPSLLPGSFAGALSTAPSAPLSHQRGRLGSACAGSGPPGAPEGGGRGGRGGSILVRRPVGLPRSDGGSGKQCVCPLSRDDGFYFLVRYIVVQSMIERQRNPDKSPRTNLELHRASGCHPVPLSRALCAISST